MKKTIAAILAGALCLTALTACGGSKTDSAAADSSSAAAGDDKTITVGATPTPHAEILNAAKDALKAEGYTLKVVEFTDYVQPNTALVDGRSGCKLLPAHPVPEQLQQGERHGSGRCVRHALRAVRHLRRQDRFHLTELAVTALPSPIPNDGSNETRALLLLSGRRPHQAEGRHRPDLRRVPSWISPRTRRTCDISGDRRRAAAAFARRRRPRCYQRQLRASG